jgi:hypothetical protein
MNMITPTFFCVLVCINYWKLTRPWDLCSTRPFDQSQRESSPAALLQRAQRWRIWSAATRYRLRAPGAFLSGSRKSSLTKVRHPDRPHRIQPLYQLRYTGRHILAVTDVNRSWIAYKSTVKYRRVVIPEYAEQCNT